MRAHLGAQVGLRPSNRRPCALQAAGAFSSQFLEEEEKRRFVMKIVIAMFGVLAGCLIFAVATRPLEQESPPGVAQVVALDECDPATFNAMLGPGFCKNVALGASTTFADLFAKAAKGTPDPNWDFEPDTLTLKKGGILNVVDQGGEPHTFTEVAQFGGGFIPPLNSGEAMAPECADGFANLAVARTRILQGSTSQITGLSKGEHRFQCCIHPWMRMKVEVK
jgi:plastocyanin